MHFQRFSSGVRAFSDDFDAPFLLLVQVWNESEALILVPQSVRIRVLHSLFNFKEDIPEFELLRLIVDELAELSRGLLKVSPGKLVSLRSCHDKEAPRRAHRALSVPTLEFGVEDKLHILQRLTERPVLFSPEFTLHDDDEARRSATRTKMARIRGAWNRLAGRRSSAHRDVHHDLAVGVLNDFKIDIHGDT